MSLMSVNEYARHRNVSHQAIGNAVAAGRIKKERSGKIDSEKADASWALRTDTVLSMRNVPRDRPAAAPPKAPAAHEAGDPSMIVSGVGMGEKIALQTAMAKLQLVKVQVEVAQAERDQIKGAVIPRAEVQEYIAFFCQMVRDNFLVMPDRLAPALAAVSDTAIVHRMLKTDIDAGLRKLSKAVVSTGF